MAWEWNAENAKANIRKHGVSFDEAATVFLDPLALTFPDPYNPGEEEREITIGCTRRPEKSAANMKKASANRLDDDLRPKYDLSKLKGGVRGKYYRQAVAASSLMLIEPDLAEVFGDAESVNRALRLLVETAEASTGPVRRRHVATDKRMQPARQKRARA